MYTANSKYISTPFVSRVLLGVRNRVAYHLNERQLVRLKGYSCGKVNEGMTHWETKTPAGRNSWGGGSEILGVGDFYAMSRTSLGKECCGLSRPIPGSNTIRFLFAYVV